MSHEVTWRKAFRLSRQDVEIPRSVLVCQNSKEATWSGVRGREMGVSGPDHVGPYSSFQELWLFL